MKELDKNNLGVFFQKLFDKSFIDFSTIDLTAIDDFENILPDFKFDYKRYFDEDGISEKNLCSRVELIGILLYRTARYYFLNGYEEQAGMYSNLGRFISGFEIYYSAEIGRSLKINHGLGTVIGARCILGENILIHQNVTIGGKNGHRPIIKDNVTIYAGAVVLGKIVVDNNAVIGANTVCFINVPENATAVGNPAKIIK